MSQTPRPLDARSHVDIRYSALAEDDCCLSCGGAIDLSEPQPGEICIDLGSGRGQDVLRLAEAVGPAGFAFGVDMAEGMLKKARRNAEKLGVENVRFVHSPLERIELPNAVADLIISNCTLNHANDKVAVWREIHRLLRPGGRFVISDIYAMDEVPERYRTDPAAVAECWAGAQTRGDTLACVQAAGLSELAFIEESVPYAKGAIQVASFTLSGRRLGGRTCC